MSIAVKEKRRVGRPRTVEGRAVYESLVRAADRCIREHGTADVSAMEIARAAGTTDKMIKYYFGSKETLMFILMKRAVRETCLELKKLESTLLKKGAGNPTWRMVSACASFALKHSASARVFPVRDPQVQREFYLRLQPTVHAQLARMFRQLIDAGVYSPELNIPYATVSLGNLLAAPTVYAFALPMHGVTSEDLQSKAWLLHIASMLDQQFRNPQRLTAESEFEPTRSNSA